MHIPNNITLNARDIKVSKSADPFKQIDDNQFILGYYSASKGEIGIYDCPTNPSVTEALFFHELIEAMDMHGDCGLNHNSITLLGNGMHQVFKQLLAYNAQSSGAETNAKSTKSVR